MLDRFLIFIGGIYLSAISFLKNISFKSENRKKESEDEKILSIFSKLDIEKNRKTTVKSDGRMDKLRDRLIPIMIRKSTITTVVLIFILLIDAVSVSNIPSVNSTS